MDADLTMRSVFGETAAELCQRQGKQQLYQILARKEARQAARRAVAAVDEVHLAEQTQAADAAAQALMNELAAEEAAEEAKNQEGQGQGQEQAGAGNSGGKRPNGCSWW